MSEGAPKSLPLIHLLPGCPLSDLESVKDFGILTADLGGNPDFSVGAKSIGDVHRGRSYTAGWNGWPKCISLH